MKCKKRRCLKKSFGHHISIIYRHLQIHLNQEFTAFGFGSGQYLYFNYISRNEGITQKELSEVLAIDKATTAKAIHKLKRQDYIRAEQHPDDKRSYRLYLTEKGQSIVPEVRRIMKNTRGILSRGMSEEESEEALGYLYTMYKNITSFNENDRRDDT
ncbi:MAG: hypothetical protein B6241_09405 [Spirochaetaceae bacterium 4572_59]|nr:MAG: hypothetical protein B6241_09405 [Spirochaetaceae bacterium 4572_59]